ncbi:MAG: helix-turn-helix transcriptional regulator [Chloroflexales bacterium]
MGTPTALIWRVRAVAIRKQIADTPEHLARLTNMHIQTTRRVWDGTPQPLRMVEVETLRRLCITLHARPPDVLVWHETTPPPGCVDQLDPPYLHWRVRAMAEARGYDRIAFARRAKIFYAEREGSKPSMAERLWTGQHRAISLAVLGRALRTLDASPGDLLDWA